MERAGKEGGREGGREGTAQHMNIPSRGQEVIEASCRGIISTAAGACVAPHERWRRMVMIACLLNLAWLPGCDWSGARCPSGLE
jgi:hypothetical protein